MRYWSKEMRVPKIILQQDQSDCGVACLLSVIRFYKGDETMENLRCISGTDATGTTLLGLYQAAVELGFDAGGCVGNRQSLSRQPGPVILHVLTESKLHHYVVCFGTVWQNGIAKFVIGDPAKGMLHLSHDELESIWVSGACLILQPGETFRTVKSIKTEKRKWVIALLKQDFSLLLVAAGVGLAIALLGLVMAVFSQRLIDDILPGKAYLKLYPGLSLLFILLLAKEGLSSLRQYFLLSQSRAFNTRVTHLFYSRLLNLPKTFFDTRKTGELTARLNDTSRIQQVISRLAGQVVIDMMVCLVTFSFLFFYSWKVGVVCFLVLPVYFLIIRKYNPHIITGQRNIMAAYATSEANYISTLRGIVPIKNYDKRELFAGINKQIYAKYQDAIFGLGCIQVKLSLAANGFGVFSLSVILLVASLQVLQGTLRIGEMMAVAGMSSALLPGIANLALTSIPLGEAKVAFNRMLEFTGIRPEDDQGRRYANDIRFFEQLETKNLGFRFRGRNCLLQDISFKVNKGEVIAIMGENGCGKTTLIQILQKHYQPESGKVLVNEDMLLSDISLKSWQHIVGAVPQDIHIFTGTVLENIAFDDAAHKMKEVLLFLTEFGFAPFLDELPRSVFTVVGDGGLSLSGGQRQMIALARALYHKPQLLIMDEATSSMDRQSEQFVMDLLKKLKTRVAVLFVTHRLHILKSFCDRAYIMESGRITAAGNHEQLLKDKNLYSAYWADLT